jgi:hypothetical protein
LVNPSTLKSIDQNWVSAISKENRSNRGNDVVYGLYAAAGTNTPPRVDILVNGTVYTARGKSVIPLNTWTFLAATYDGSTLSLYVNGTLVGSRSVRGSITNSPDPLRIGGDWSGEMLTGMIDNVRIYNTAMSASQIQADMGSAAATSATAKSAAGAQAAAASTSTASASTSAAIEIHPSGGSSARGSARTVTISRRQSVASPTYEAIPGHTGRWSPLLVKRIDRSRMSAAWSGLS